MSYDSNNSIILSDHRPVFSQFSLYIDSMEEVKTYDFLLMQLKISCYLPMLTWNQIAKIDRVLSFEYLIDQILQTHNSNIKFDSEKNNL
jgi:endonuclease/exonuclease/phosphatase (EEP) superfamily protein YafD